jgi:hypothetical protein
MHLMHTSTRSASVYRVPVVLALLVLGCPADVAELSLSVGQVRLGGEAPVSVSALVGAEPGAGAVELSTSLGELELATLTLAEGAARTTLRCPRTTPGCVAGASITVTARWNSPRGVVTETATARVVETPDGGVGGGPGDGGRDAGVDGGADGGRDGGMGEPIDPDGGLDFDGGTFLQGRGPLLLGLLGPPRTLGFSALTQAAPVLLGFNQRPDQVFLYSERLVYVRRGFLYAWEEDFPDAGEPGVDAGDADAGEADAGELDGGDPDSGVDAGEPDAGFGLFPLFNPEGNDPLIASCLGLFGVPDSGWVHAAFPTPSGGLWVACSRTLNGPPEAYRKGNRFLAPPAEHIVPMAASEQFIFGIQRPPDGGLPVPVAFSSGPSATPTPLPERRAYARGAVRVTSQGFEFLALDERLDQCLVGSLDRTTGAFTELTLPAAVAGRFCLSARFDGARDVVLTFASIDGGQVPHQVLEVPFARPSPADAGLADGGRPDAGRPDAGRPDGGRSDSGVVDAGLVTVRVSPGPPSDFLAEPPSLSIDFTQPIDIIPP